MSQNKESNKIAFIGITLNLLLILLVFAFLTATVFFFIFIYKKPVDYYATLIILGFMLINASMMGFLIPMIIKINNGNKDDCFKEKVKEVIDAYIEKHKPNASQKNNEVTKK